MGVVTGVAGGIVRDVLCDEIPLIFSPGNLCVLQPVRSGFAGDLLPFFRKPCLGGFPFPVFHFGDPAGGDSMEAFDAGLRFGR